MSGYISDETTPANLRELFEHMRSETLWPGAPTKFGQLDWSALPTFGGEDVADTGSGPVWSWDATQVIIGDDPKTITIEARNWDALDVKEGAT